MFGLVRFYDQSFGIYSMKNILMKSEDDLCLVKHRGTKYEAKLLEKNEKKEKLKIIQDKMENEVQSAETSRDYDFSDFSIGIEYIDINRSSELSISELYTPSADIEEKGDINGEFEDIATIKLPNEEYLRDEEALDDPPEEDGLQNEEPSEYADNSDEDPNYEMSESEEYNSDCTEMEHQDLPNNCSSVLSERDPIFNDVGQSDILDSSRKVSPSKTAQVHLSASLTEPSCDDSNMKVAKSRGKKGDKKWNFCFFCHSKQQKIARHLELKHKEEEEVKKFIQLPKGCVERGNLIGKIRKRGNFLFNTDENFNDGELIVTRRPTNPENKSSKDYRACANCKGFFSKTTLRMHFKSCTGIEGSSKRLATLLSKKISGRIHPKASPMVKNHLFPPLRDDHVSRTIKYDELIIIYSNKMVEKYRELRHFQMIRQRLRLLGNFLINMRSFEKEITDLASIYDPKYVDSVLSAINICAKYTESTNQYRAPSVAFNLGTLLKQIGQIQITESIKCHNDEIKKNTKDFLKIFTQEVNIHVNRTVAETQLRMSRSKNVLLPTMNDIKKLCDFLAQKRETTLRNLRTTFSKTDWLELAEATLTSVQVFNRRRAGEVERIFISDYEKYETVARSNIDLFQSLPEKSKKIAQKYVRFTIRGKLNRTVPVLLDNQLCECIKTILAHRQNMVVSKNNPFIFGTPGSDNQKHPHLQACALMRKFAEACGADYPKRLRGTNLRKHMATSCINLNLESQEISDLSNFMGHSENIHKGIYRQPILAREVLGISKLLEAAQGVVDEESSDDDDFEQELPTEGPEDHCSVNVMASTSVTTPTGLEKMKDKRRARNRSSILKRTRWTAEEKEAIFRVFGEYMEKNVLPPLKEIQLVIKETPALQNRTSPQIKTWIHNQFRNSKKKLSFSELK